MQKMLLDLNKLENISILELAKISGLHRNTISGFLSGKFSPYSSAYLKLCKSLKFEPEELLINKDNQDIILKVKKILEKHVQDYSNRSFMLFGSRLDLTNTKYSDLDLGISGGTNKINLKEFLKLKRYLDELFDSLTIKIDIVNFDLATDNFFSYLKKEPKLLFGSIQAYYYFLGVLSEKKAK